MLAVLGRSPLCTLTHVLETLVLLQDLSNSLGLCPPVNGLSHSAASLGAGSLALWKMFALSLLELVSLGYSYYTCVCFCFYRLQVDWVFLFQNTKKIQQANINYFGFGNDQFYLFIQILPLLLSNVTSCQTWRVKSFSTEKKLLHRNPATPRLVQNEDKNKQPTGTNTSAHLEQHKGAVHIQGAAPQCHFQLQLHLQRNCQKFHPS